MGLLAKISYVFSQIFEHDRPTVRIKLLNGDDKLLPVKAHWDDSGYDVRSAEKKVVVIQPGETVSVSCGFAMELPHYYEAQIRPRSGLALKHSITVLNTPGTIDNGYRGEVKVILANFGKNEFKVHYGDRIAQMVIMYIPEMLVIPVSKLSETDRNKGGFGSSGTN